MRILAGIGALAIIIAVGAAVFFFGGYFNVAASEPDPGIVKWALTKVRAASIDHHARLAAPGNLDDPEIVRAGARAFSERGCTNCHGAPGVNWQKFSEGLNPDPPDLKDIVHERQPAQLQERHQDDRNAELWRDRDGRQGNLVHRGVYPKAAKRVGGRLQGVDREAIENMCAQACPPGAGTRQAVGPVVPA